MKARKKIPSTRTLRRASQGYKDSQETAKI